MPSHDLVLLAPPNTLADLDAELAALDEALQDTLAASIAPATTKVYQHDWSMFERWTAAHGLPSLPASSTTVARYLTDLSKTHKPATIGQHMSAISAAHQAAGFEEPPTRSLLVRKTVSGIRRQLGVAPAAKTALAVADVRAIIRDRLRPGIIGQRDRALLLVGFQSAFRRSELVGIDVEHIEFVAEGMVILLPRSKTDQEGAGRKVGIPFGHEPETCAVGATREWMAAAGIDSGPLFRPVDRHGRVGSGRLCNHAVSLAVKHYVEAIGRDPRDFGAHSFRAGHATAAALAGCHERDIMRQTGHRSTAMLRRYIRDGSLFRSNSAAAIDL
jgi:integrase